VSSPELDRPFAEVASRNKLAADLDVKVVIVDQALEQLVTEKLLTRLPSLTSLKDPEWVYEINACLDWFARGGQDWDGPLLIEPFDADVFVGESTDPHRARE